jgi:hypothetical protein
MTNSEGRIPNNPATRDAGFRLSGFGLLSDFVIRISDFNLIPSPSAQAARTAELARWFW